MDGDRTHALWFTRPTPYHLATTPRKALGSIGFVMLFPVVTSRWRPQSTLLFSTHSLRFRLTPVSEPPTKRNLLSVLRRRKGKERRRVSESFCFLPSRRQHTTWGPGTFIYFCLTYIPRHGFCLTVRRQKNCFASFHRTHHSDYFVFLDLYSEM